MPWNLEIHTIDVAQGESSLLIARNDDNGRFYSMLIDGGLQRYGRVVHDYVSRQLLDRRLNVMVTTHYDEDHSEGQISILLADNLSNIAFTIGEGVGNAIMDRLETITNINQRAAVGGAAFIAVVSGAYGDYENLVDDAVNAAMNAWAESQNRPNRRNDAILFGMKAGLRFMDTIENRDREDSLMKNSVTGATRRAGLATVNPVLNLPDEAWNFVDVATTAFFESVAPPPPQVGAVQNRNLNYGFYTNRLYRSADIYNNGELRGLPANNNVEGYFRAVSGKIPLSTFTPTAPGLNRDSDVPTLGQELWQIGDPVAPRVYCVSVLGNVLNSNTPVGGDALNKISIGLAVVFNQFVYFTGGDLTVSGLDMIPNAVLGNPLMGNPESIPVYKAGHHGSSESNSAFYLAQTQTRCCFISSGSTVFGDTDVVLPTQEVITMLNAAPDMAFYYMTNCKQARVGVPASNGENQMVEDNIAMIAGDNKFDQGETPNGDNVFEPKQNRGNIVLRISQAESQSPNIDPDAVLDDGEVYRQFRVTYWEEDIPDHAIDAIGTRTETITF